MDEHLVAWLDAVLAERARILKRVQPIEKEPNQIAEAEAIYRGAAALIEWEKFRVEKKS
jgi:hypothetical protein